MINAKVDSVKRVMHNYYLRYYTLDRCGQRDEGEQYYLCNNYEMETKNVKKLIRRKKGHIAVTVKVVVPVPVGMKNTNTTPSKGVGKMRLFDNNVKSIDSNIRKLDTTKTQKYHYLIDAIATNTRLAMEAWEHNDLLETGIDTSNDASTNDTENNMPLLTFNNLTG